MAPPLVVRMETLMVVLSGNPKAVRSESVLGRRIPQPSATSMASPLGRRSVARLGSPRDDWLENPWAVPLGSVSDRCSRRALVTSKACPWVVRSETPKVAQSGNLKAVRPESVLDRCIPRTLVTSMASPLGRHSIARLGSPKVDWLENLQVVQLGTVLGK